MLSKIKILFSFSFGISLSCFRTDVPNVLEQSYTIAQKYNAVGKIVCFTSESRISCTGTVIDPYTILTCAHFFRLNNIKKVFFMLDKKDQEDDSMFYQSNRPAA